MSDRFYWRGDFDNGLNLIGGPGDDVLRGDDSDNLYDGGAGNDTLYASAGSDTLIGGEGTDILDYSFVDADITLSRGGVITKSDGLGTDIIENFDIEVIRANPNRTNTIDATTGTTAYMVMSLADGILTINDLPEIGTATIRIENFQNVNGSENADDITGDDLANVIDGKAGDDVMNAGGGDDTMIGSEGSDTYDGGDGFDILSYEAFEQGVTLVRGGTVEKADGSVDTISGFSIEHVVGSLTGIDTIDATGGNDASMRVDLSANRLLIDNLPGVGSAELVVEHFDNAYGSESSDELIGSDGANVLRGGSGNDTLAGLAGSDTLIGGEGSDTFRFGRFDSLYRSRDEIVDLAIGVDVVDGPVQDNDVDYLGEVDSLDPFAISNLLTFSTFRAGEAATFTYDDGGTLQTFLAFNDDGRSGFQARSDGLVEITGYTGEIENLTVA